MIKGTGDERNVTVVGKRLSDSIVRDTRDLLCTHKRFFCVYTTMRNYAKLCETMRNYAKLYETMRNYAKLCETMRNYAKLCETMKIGRPIPSKCVYLHAPAHRI